MRRLSDLADGGVGGSGRYFGLLDVSLLTGRFATGVFIWLGLGGL